MLRNKRRKNYTRVTEKSIKGKEEDEQEKDGKKAKRG